eukprot:2002312-Rhodomonas_salina.1
MLETCGRNADNQNERRGQKKNVVIRAAEEDQERSSASLGLGGPRTCGRTRTAVLAGAHLRSR